MNTSVTPIRTAAETALLERFAALKTSLPGTGELVRRRDEAFAIIERSGLPHRRIEDWKYTDLRALMREAPPLAGVPSRSQAMAALAEADAGFSLDVPRLAFVNGHFVASCSDLAQLPAGVSVRPLAEALAKGDPALDAIGAITATRANAAMALNTAFMMDGAIVRVAKGVQVVQPLHLTFANHGTAPFATSPRVMIELADGASLTLVESHSGPSGINYHTNTVVEVVAGAGANLVHVRINREGDAALALSTLAARLGAKAELTAVAMTAGAGASRHQVFLSFAGEGSTARLNGATMIKGRQHADTTLVVDHATPGCESRELYKTVIDDEATGVFQGKIIVRPDAQKTDGRMMSAAVLLSETGAMNNKPELEIFADDVQCAHGATCGALDEDLLFYLMARGLPRREAEALMVQAFLGEAIELVDHEELRDRLNGLAAAWLEARAQNRAA